MALGRWLETSRRPSFWKEEIPFMKIRSLTRVIAVPLLGLFIALAAAASGKAQAPMQTMARDHDHQDVGTPRPMSAADNDLVQIVRRATERFKSITDISGPGTDYALTFGCVSGGDYGAMGLHYVKGSILHDGKINPDDPEIILFEPTRTGGIQLTGVDYLVFAAEWEAKNGKGSVPSLNGQLFHYFDSPNRFGLDPFYTLHVWAWKDNPNGTFTNWNPTVSCDGFNPRLFF